ncbi:MAG TPA: hypothetical protein VI542_20700 [Candidatus Tectomicrobia bacterium]
MDPADRMTTEVLQQQLAALDAHYQGTVIHTAALARQVQQQASSTGDASDGPSRSAKTEAEIARRREEARTTPDDLKHMLGRQSYPTWMHAAYAAMWSSVPSNCELSLTCAPTPPPSAWP